MFYSSIARPFLFHLDPEFVHRQTLRTGHLLSKSSVARRLFRKLYNVQFPALATRPFGLQLANPIGLAAGFDKGGLVHDIIAAIGFGHMEIGSISYRPWPGNPSPTLLRLPADGGLINRPGLNSEGSEIVFNRLRNADFQIPIGFNLVKTADPQIAGEAAIDDYVQSFLKFYPLADFVTLNLSCPNTSEGRTFEHPALLAPFLRRVQENRDVLAAGKARKPVLIKLSPDLEEGVLDEILGLAQSNRIDGCVIANTTSRRENLKTPKRVLEDFGFGGLSGRPIKPYVQDMVSGIYRKTAGKLPIVACGGVGCDARKHPADEVWEYLQLGASLVQLHTGLIYSGPVIARSINEGLVEILRRNQFSSLEDFLQQRRGRQEA